MTVIRPPRPTPPKVLRMDSAANGKGFYPNELPAELKLEEIIH